MQKLIRLLLVVCIVVGIMGVVKPSVGYACSCEPQTAQGMFERAHVIFSGRVTDIKQGKEESNWDRFVTLEVSKIWKGQAQTEQVVRTQPHSAACGVEFETGRAYLVYAYEQDGHLQTNLCTRTGLYSQAYADRLYLGQGKLVDERREPWRGPDAALIGFYLIAVGLALFLRKRV